jgi:hypothetical protein
MFKINYSLTSPVIRTTALVFWGSLEKMVIILLNGPGLLVSYLILIVAERFGMIGSLGQVGTVQPQDPE